MKLILFLLLFLPTFLGFGQDRPNVIIIFVDDMGYGDLSSFGHPTIKTPHLDKMVQEGVKLTQFYSTSPICTPSRAALLTGKYPVKTGIYGERGVFFPDSDGGLSNEELTISSFLKENNYKTACIGKWHLGHLPQYLPNAHGFDYYFGIPYSNDLSPETNKWEGAKNFPPTPLMENNSTIEQEPDQRFLTKRYTEKSLEFIQQSKDEPFFLYLAHTFPHVPLFASPEFENASTRGLYGDVVEELDWSVGQIMALLEKLDLRDNTFILFTSDNGPWIEQRLEGGDAGMFKLGKGTLWEGGVRVPGILSFPKHLKAGIINEKFFSTLDVFPTILKMVNPAKQVDNLDGADMISDINQKNSPSEKVLFYYHQDKIYAIRKGAYKAHFRSHDSIYGGNRNFKEYDTPLIFDLNKDPGEKFPLKGLDEKVIKEFKALYDRQIENVIPAPSQIDFVLNPEAR